MKILVEQIIVRDSILIYSNFAKYTDSPDEEGADYEYDFESIYANTDDIMNTIIRLYGANGLITLVKKFSSGEAFDYDFEAIEFEENSPLKDLISKIANSNNSSDFKIDDTLTPTDIEKIISDRPPLQPSDSIFLLTGMFDSLDTNEDLNVMKMLGSTENNTDSETIGLCLDYLQEIGYNFGQEDLQNAFTFNLGGAEKIALIGKYNFFGLTIVNDQIVLDFPDNEQQEKMHLLFQKYTYILKATKMKTKIIFEIGYNEVAKRENTEDLPELYVLFDVLSEKFISKETRLTL